MYYCQKKDTRCVKTSDKDKNDDSCIWNEITKRCKNKSKNDSTEKKINHESMTNQLVSLDKKIDKILNILIEIQEKIHIKPSQPKNKSNGEDKPLSLLDDIKKGKALKHTSIPPIKNKQKPISLLDELKKGIHLKKPTQTPKKKRPSNNDQFLKTMLDDKFKNMLDKPYSQDDDDEEWL